MGKHAFLIIAHDDIDFLKCLLLTLDDPRADIFLHVDKNSSVDTQSLLSVCNYSRVFNVDPINVVWGSDAIITAEMLLLRESTSCGKYDYYHLVSGHDYPLVSKFAFYNFFDTNQGTEFIDCRYENIDHLMFRIKFYYPFQKILNGKSLVNSLLNKTCMLLQSIIGMDRIHKSKIQYGYGSQWFSITDTLSRYVVSKAKFIEENFYKSICADELFLQSVYVNSPYFHTNKRFQNDLNSSCLEQNVRNCLRAVDFSKGDGKSPRIFTETDFDLLTQSSCLFARKLDSKHSMKLVKMLNDFWKNGT